MKKLLTLALASAFAFPIFAQEEEGAPETAPIPQNERKPEDSAMWPAPIAFGQMPRSADVIGLRITFPYSTSQGSVTGVDLGLWGRSFYFEGLQVNLLRNDVIDRAAGIQVGCYNSIGTGEMIGAQVGLWNEAMSLRGVQAGLINVVGQGEGFQIGLINRAEMLHGYQIGLINIIREAELQFCPIVNIGF